MILQEGLFRLGRKAALQPKSFVRTWGDMAKVCPEALPLHQSLNAWLETDAAGDALSLSCKGRSSPSLGRCCLWAAPVQPCGSGGTLPRSSYVRMIQEPWPLRAWWRLACCRSSRTGTAQAP